MRRPKPPAAAPGSADDVEVEFYEALQRGDIDRLMGLWSDDDEISCVHPGGPRLVGALAIRASFEAIPVDLEEAAMVDGATRFQAFLRVVLPAARPAIAVTALFAFMTAYNEYVLAATLIDREEMFTLPVVLQRYIGEYDARWDLFAAGALLVSIPVMALFYVAQRHLIAGLTAGGVKG